MAENKNSKTGSSGTSGAFVPRVRHSKRRNKGGIGPDGKPLAPILITAVVIIMLLVAVYFGKVEGWFKAADPETIEATVPPEVTPQPTVSAARPFSALDEKALTVFAVDVGSGRCSILISPNGKTMLVDSGGPSHAREVISALKELGVSKLDIAFATSADEESIGGFAEILAEVPANYVYVAPSVADSAYYAAIIDASSSVTVSQPGHSVVQHWDKSCTVDSFVVVNNGEGGSCTVLRVEHGGSSFLLTGMLTKTGETELIEGYADKLRSSVLFVAKCGAEDACGKELINCVSPGYAVISADGSLGRPANETLAGLNAKGVKLYRTDRTGTVKMVVDKNGLKFD